MVVGEVPEPVDLLVVGAGPGGYVAAVRAAELGRRVVVVDREGVEGGPGGACLRVGCIPSKALIELAHAYETTRTAARAGLRVAGAEVDLGTFQGRRREIVEKLGGGVGGLFERHKIRYVAGELTFSRPDRAAVALADGNSSFLEFKQAIVATGSRPFELPTLPVDGERVLTSTGALALEEVPATMAIVGGGYIGLEIGTYMAKLGTKVTVLEAMPRLLATYDQDVANLVGRSLKKRNVNVLTSALAKGVKEKGGQLVVEAEVEGKTQQINFPTIPDQKLNTKGIELKATSTAGVPVYYYVKEGPAALNGNRLTLTKIPPRAKFPVKVTVVAWQYGSSVEPKLQTAEPVERSFYLVK